MLRRASNASLKMDGRSSTHNPRENIHNSRSWTSRCGRRMISGVCASLLHLHLLSRTGPQFRLSVCWSTESLGLVSCVLVMRVSVKRLDGPGVLAKSRISLPLEIPLFPGPPHRLLSPRWRCVFWFQALTIQRRRCAGGEQNPSLVQGEVCGRRRQRRTTVVTDVLSVAKGAFHTSKMQCSSVSVPEPPLRYLMHPFSEC